MKHNFRRKKSSFAFQNIFAKFYGLKKYFGMYDKRKGIFKLSLVDLFAKIYVNIVTHVWKMKYTQRIVK